MMHDSVIHIIENHGSSQWEIIGEANWIQISERENLGLNAPHFWRSWTSLLSMMILFASSSWRTFLLSVPVVGVIVVEAGVAPTSAPPSSMLIFKTHHNAIYHIYAGIQNDSIDTELHLMNRSINACRCVKSMHANVVIGAYIVLECIQYVLISAYIQIICLYTSALTGIN